MRISPLFSGKLRLWDVQNPCWPDRCGGRSIAENDNNDNQFRRKWPRNSSSGTQIRWEELRTDKKADKLLLIFSPLDSQHSRHLSHKNFGTFLTTQLWRNPNGKKAHSTCLTIEFWNIIIEFNRGQEGLFCNMNFKNHNSMLISVCSLYFR